MNITVINGEISDLEQKEYVKYIEKKYNRSLDTIEIILDGDYVDLSYKFVPVNFERIRRITGYLVGTVDRFNDAKRAEEKDRVKHEPILQMEQI
ncbi:MAG TPA: anaerobic ribonucleoside-triphosphate reductase [Anaerovoracaceae bacterium]|nr:anaerobic ribonucleoside-triphosphate reductase [Anaerovoracaceae bacterium]